MLLSLLWLLHAAPAPLEVTVTGARSTRGHVRCLVFTSEPGFPTDEAKAAARAEGVIVEGRAVCRFADVGAAPFAVSVMHDEDDDGRLGTNFFGVPTEGVGFSNGAKSGAFGPPAFSRARVSPTAALSVALAY